jgi:hypothetical protein
MQLTVDCYLNYVCHAIGTVNQTHAWVLLCTLSTDIENNLSDPWANLMDASNEDEQWTTKEKKSRKKAKKKQRENVGFIRSNSLEHLFDLKP